jgi:hypothetical protein
MTTKDTIYIVIILVLVFIILKSGNKPVENTYTLRLEKEAERFKSLYKEKKKEADSLIVIADSLKKIKPKIKIKYEKIYQTIPTLHADSVVSEFQRIFAKEGVND